MSKIYLYDQRHKPLAQNLRREMTPQERRLWYGFLKTCPAQFRRQKQFGAYIVDFYCAKLDLVVEIDGSQHYSPEEKQHDAIRTAYLNSLGLTVVRFSNYNVDCHFEGVCAQIYNMIQAKLTTESDRDGERPLPT